MDIKLDEVAFLRVRTALQAKEIFELRTAKMEAAVNAALRKAFEDAGLEPNVLYELDTNARVARRLDPPQDNAVK